MKSKSPNIIENVLIRDIGTASKATWFPCKSFQAKITFTANIFDQYIPNLKLYLPWTAV